MRDSQDAFLHSKNILTGAPWKPRYGVAYFKNAKPYIGKVEQFLHYKPLHRSGHLLRSLGVARKMTSRGWQIVLFNTADYAEVHDKGGHEGKRVAKPPYVGNGATGVQMGGHIHARPFLAFRPDTMRAVMVLVGKRMREFGW